MHIPCIYHDIYHAHIPRIYHAPCLPCIYHAHLGVAGVINAQVLRLEVAMHDTRTVQRLGLRGRGRGRVRVRARARVRVRTRVRVRVR